MTPSGAKLAELDEVGITIIPQVVEPTTVATLRGELMAAMEEDLRLRPNVFDAGMVHNCMVRGPAMAALLDHRLMNAYVQSILGETCILYAYQSSSLAPDRGTNYGRRIHRDSPRVIPGYPTNVGVIFALDDFTPSAAFLRTVWSNRRWLTHHPRHPPACSQIQAWLHEDHIIFFLKDLILTTMLWFKLAIVKNLRYHVDPQIGTCGDIFLSKLNGKLYRINNMQIPWEFSNWDTR